MITPEKRPTEKILKTTTIAFFSTDTSFRKDFSVFSSNHPPTAPPFFDKQSYASLIGIIKRLD
jgi:hypothetical protein